MRISGSNVLVTGGAGLIGSHLVDLLLAQGCRVKILDNLEPEVHPHGMPEWIPNDVEFLSGQLQNAEDMESALADVDFVFHQAAFTGFSTDASKDFETNAIGTARIYESIARRGFPIKKIVVASSQAVYGEGKYHCQIHGAHCPGTRRVEQLRRQEWDPRCPQCGEVLEPVPTDELSAKQGSTPYAISKYAGERLAMSYGSKLGIPTVALRYAVGYGPRQSIHNAYVGPISIFSMRLLNNLSPVVYEDGGQLRDWMYVQDAARANVFVMEDERTDFESYNVGTGLPTPVGEIADLITQHLDKDIPPRVAGEFRPGDTRHLIHDVTKLQALGFVAETPLTEGIRRYLDWLLGLERVEDPYSALEQRLKKAGALQT